MHEHALTFSDAQGHSAHLTFSEAYFYNDQIYAFNSPLSFTAFPLRCVVTIEKHNMNTKKRAIFFLYLFLKNCSFGYILNYYFQSISFNMDSENINSIWLSLFKTFITCNFYFIIASQTAWSFLSAAFKICSESKDFNRENLIQKK